MRTRNNIVIIDYEMGNARSIQNMLGYLGFKTIISFNHEVITRADKIILPGVGHFSEGISRLQEMDLVKVLNRKVVKEKTPVLGICLGMQLFMNSSEEGKCPGLAWIDGEVVRLEAQDTRLKIPHMGWNRLAVIQGGPILKDVAMEDRFYFVHSYHAVCRNKQDIAAYANYGQDFVSVVTKNNIFGVQFHPEKSHRFGMKILKNFGALRC